MKPTASAPPRYWRSLAEHNGELPPQHDEFPHGVGDAADGVSRRDAMRLAAASLAMAGLTGCERPTPERIVPYVNHQPGVPDKPLFFATSLLHAGYAMGVLGESYTGRPTKIEGNPDHPASLGATDTFAQAAVLGLYDPDRSQAIYRGGDIATASGFSEELDRYMGAARDRQGRGLRLLTGRIGSPLMIDQIRRLLRQLPAARWHVHEPIDETNARRGAEIAFGEALTTVYRFDRADVVLSLDCDFLFDSPGGVRYAREFARRRRVRADAGASAKMNRLYAVEATPTITGAKADHRLRMRPSEIAAFAGTLAAELGITGAADTRSSAADEQTQFAERPVGDRSNGWILAVADDLREHEGRCLVLAGRSQPPEVHALVHAINDALGALGRTVAMIEPPAVEAGFGAATLRELCDDIDAGQVETLLIIDSNPVYTAPVDLEVAERIGQVAFTAHLGLHRDETARVCRWHLPMSHELESWGDGRAYDGAIGVIQPLVERLYETRTPHDLLASLLGEAVGDDLARVRGFYTEPAERGGARDEETERRRDEAGAAPAARAGERSPGADDASRQSRDRKGASLSRSSAPNGDGGGGGNGGAGGGRGAGLRARESDVDAETKWRGILRLGVVPDSAPPVRSVRVDTAAVATAWRSAFGETDRQPGTTPAANDRATAAGRGLEAVFKPDAAVWDGRYANNAWLQELPRPLTKITWDNAALISPTTAGRLGLDHKQIVRLSLAGQTVLAPLFIAPGHADDCVTLPLGYGRRHAGAVGNAVGFDAYRLRRTGGLWFAPGLQIMPTNQRHELAVTQEHHRMEGRELIRHGTLEEFRRDPRAIAHPHGGIRKLSLYPQWPQDGQQWGMGIDMTACTGCGACVAACQAENNIPTVGREQVRLGREMQWIRIDHYYVGSAEDPEVMHQPVPCMHCENAPCEVVCPVAATTHSADGLNEMTYNRCVGTRYCSNNCPYKVRRFNFLQYADQRTEVLKLQRNPEVSVRARGVMEKCTYCVQRIRVAQIEARKENRPILDGEVVTACQQVCPAEAIIFGDITDASSRIAAEKAQPHDYGLLEELNTRPRTTYLAVLRNPNPKLASAT